MNPFFKWAASLLVFIILLFVIMMVVFSRAGDTARKYVGDFKPDASRMSDGLYHGGFSTLGGHISTEVTFEIKDSSLWLINFEKLYGTPVYGATERVKDRIDSLKTLDFDAVTGATITSHLAKAAIKNAVENGPR